MNILRKLRPKTLSEEKAISVKIINTSEKGYLFEYSFVGDKEKTEREETPLRLIKAFFLKIFKTKFSVT